MWLFQAESKCQSGSLTWLIKAIWDSSTKRVTVPHSSVSHGNAVEPEEAGNQTNRGGLDRARHAAQLIFLMFVPLINQK
jgi:hypothetical protein